MRLRILATKSSELRRARLEREATAMWVEVLHTQRDDVRLSLGITKASMGTGTWRPPPRTGDFSILDYRALLAPTTIFAALRAAEFALQRGAALGTFDAVSNTVIERRRAEMAGATVNEWARGEGPGAVSVVDRTSVRRIALLLGAWVLGREMFTMDDDLDSLYADSRAATIGVTLVSTGYVEGLKTVYRNDGKTKSLSWVTMGDERMCPVCGPLHGQVGTLEGVFPGGLSAPVHARCRCYYRPFVS